MRRLAVHTLVCSALTLLLGTSVAHARAFEVTAGLKTGAGLSLWTAPSGADLNYNDASGAGHTFKIPFFDENRAGYNYTLGGYVEMRFFEYVGLDVGFFLNRSVLWEETDWTYTLVDNNSGTVQSFQTKTEQELTFTSLRIPIIIKAILPVRDAVRLYLGIGPEISLGSSATASHEVSGGSPLKGSRAYFGRLPFPPAPREDGADYISYTNPDALSAKPQDDIYLTTVMGVDIKAGAFRIPVELRFGYNMSQPSNYYDRVEYDYGFDQTQVDADGRTRTHSSGYAFDGRAAPPSELYATSGTFKARDSMYLQLLVGIAVDY